MKPPPDRFRRRLDPRIAWSGGHGIWLFILLFSSWTTTSNAGDNRYKSNRHRQFFSVGAATHERFSHKSMVTQSIWSRLRGGASSNRRTSSSSSSSSSRQSSPSRKNRKAATKKEISPPPPPPAPAKQEKKQKQQSSAALKKDKTQQKEDPWVLFLMRLLFLTYYGSLGSLMPYLPVYYHSLGHGGLIIGMLGAVKPLTTFIVAPFWGIIADQTGNKFRILYLTFLISLLGQLLVAVRHDVNYILAMVFFTALVNAPVKSLMDSLVMEQLYDKSQYGRMRLWGQLGFGLGSSGVGVLLHRSQRKASQLAAAAAAAGLNVTPQLPSFAIIAQPPAVDTFSKLPSLQVIIEYADKFWQNLTGYKLLFSTYAALSIPTWWCLRAFQRSPRRRDDLELAPPPPPESKTSKSSSTKPVEKKKSHPKTVEGMLLLLQNADAMLFFFLVLVVGISSGIIENFAYVRIREVGGSGREMGLSRLVSSVAGVPMFWWSGPLTEMFGADRILVWSLLSYVVRFFVYAVMQNAYQGLPAEALRGVVFAAFWSTGTVYAHRISPPGLDATMLMFLNAMYGGLGQSLGAIIGGKLQSKFGTVQTFVYSALFDLVLVVFVTIYLNLRKESNFRNPTPILPKTGKELKRV